MHLAFWLYYLLFLIFARESMRRSRENPDVKSQKSLVNTCEYVYNNRCWEGADVKTSELTRRMKKEGCCFLGHRGEHDLWFSPITGKEIIVPRHPSKEIPTGTANKIKRDAGLK